LCIKSRTLSQLVGDRMNSYPASGEINSSLIDPQAAISRVLDKYKNKALAVDYTDGISIEFADWRFNLRSSNTEPVVRLNVESRANKALMQ
ncbi:phosphomannomutase, partial [Klebsiella pneumoniae]|nr:phosphomannomutase [Klebsiella pneumoniae]